MKKTQLPYTQTSNFRTIAGGLALAVLGTGSVSLLMLALSHLYVGRYVFAAGETFACFVGGGVFFLTYGRYLDRLEQWIRSDAGLNLGEVSSPIPGELEAAPASSPEGRQPLPTDTIVACSSAAYGVLIILAGVIWTRGSDLVLNLVSGILFLAGAVVVAWLGRRSRQGESRSDTRSP